MSAAALLALIALLAVDVVHAAAAWKMDRDNVQLKAFLTELGLARQ